MLFTNVTVAVETAALFRTISLGVRLGLYELDGAPLLETNTELRRPRAQRLRNVRAERAMLNQLLLVQEQDGGDRSDAGVRRRAEVEG